MNDNNETSLSFESSWSSDSEENYEEIQEHKDLEESEFIHISNHSNQRTLSSPKSKICIKIFRRLKLKGLYQKKSSIATSNPTYKKKANRNWTYIQLLQS